MAKIGLAPVFVVTWLAACASQAQKAPLNSLPSDATLKSTFQSNEANFNKLAEMSDKDSKIGRIAKDFTTVVERIGATPRTATDQELPPSRWDEYRALFQQLGVPSGLAREGGCLFMPAAIKDVGTVDSEEKGYAFCPSVPSPLYSSLDKTPLKVEKPLPAFRALHKNWYLYWRYNE